MGNASKDASGDWPVGQKNSRKFFANRDCEYYPCHEDADTNDFNCMFCFCPLYMLGDSCGGKFVYTEKGVKSCINCDLPHKASYYDVIMDKLKEANKK
ncbi:MAG: cysteine-rich small domain-containing protein [Coriobacteriia bacterium]|nr:cysteine-rich small domain-containing protein [Coriobacteriia bacterium]